MANVIRVGIADMKICKYPDMITTIGLGSCVGVVLFDDTLKIAGLVHIMLPDSTKIKHNQNKLKFADTGIECLVEELANKGVKLCKLKAKIAGGAKMFDFTSADSELGSIGENNVKAVKAKLESLGISIIAEDVGLNYGRTITFNPDTCELMVSKAGKQYKII